MRVDIEGNELERLLGDRKFGYRWIIGMGVKGLCLHG